MIQGALRLLPKAPPDGSFRFCMCDSRWGVALSRKANTGDGSRKTQGRAGGRSAVHTGIQRGVQLDTALTALTGSGNTSENTGKVPVVDILVITAPTLLVNLSVVRKLALGTADARMPTRESVRERAPLWPPRTHAAAGGARFVGRPP